MSLKFTVDQLSKSMSVDPCSYTMAEFVELYLKSSNLQRTIMDRHLKEKVVDICMKAATIWISSNIVVKVNFVTEQNHIITDITFKQNIQ